MIFFCFYFFGCRSFIFSNLSFLFPPLYSSTSTCKAREWTRREREAWHGDFAEPRLNSDELCRALALEIPCRGLVVIDSARRPPPTLNSLYPLASPPPSYRASWNSLLNNCKNLLKFSKFAAGQKLSRPLPPAPARDLQRIPPLNLQRTPLDQL